MCQIRGLFVTVREGKACLERGQGSPTLPYHFCYCVQLLMCVCVCVLHSCLHHVHIRELCHLQPQGGNSNITAERSFSCLSLSNVLSINNYWALIHQHESFLKEQESMMWTFPWYFAPEWHLTEKNRLCTHPDIWGSHHCLWVTLINIFHNFLTL